MWTPDVYEGAPTPVTAFFAAAPKVAAMALFVRVVITAFPTITIQWQQIVVFVSIASMGLGAFAAIGQTNIKRLLAYSSIGHMGFALIGLAAGTAEGVQGVLVYMAIYMAMTLGTFACILAMRRAGGNVENISDLAGRAHRTRHLVVLLSPCCCSLARRPFRRSRVSSQNFTCSSLPSRPVYSRFSVLGVLARALLGATTPPDHQGTGISTNRRRRSAADAPPNSKLVLARQLGVCW